MSVLNPGSAIHPVVGSIFSAPAAEVASESFGNAGSVFADDVRKGLEAAASSPALRERPRAAEASREGEEPARLIAVTESANARGFLIASRDLPNAHENDDWRAQSAGRARDAEAAVANLTYSPLIAAALAPSPPTHSLELQRKPDRDASLRYPSPSRTSDEIEIHIGRIEVAAMHPAPVQAAPAKSDRRAPSLDDYLKRRDGRPL